MRADMDAQAMRGGVLDGAQLADVADGWRMLLKTLCIVKSPDSGRLLEQQRMISGDFALAASTALSAGAGFSDRARFRSPFSLNHKDS